MEEHNTETPRTSRRRMLEIIGTTAVAVPVLGLSACGGDSGGQATSSAPAEPAPMPAKAAEMESAVAGAADDMQDAAESAMDTAESAMDSGENAMGEAAESAEEMAGDMAAEADAAAETIATDMAQLDENSAQAMGLGYRQDATTVDASTQTRYRAGQQCSNCVLFQGSDAEWGGCPLFAGQMVKASGWCSAYSAAS